MVLASKLLASLTLLIIIAVAGADNYTDCDAKWMAYGYSKKLNDERREKVQGMLLRIQADVYYSCEFEGLAAQIRDEVLQRNASATESDYVSVIEGKKRRGVTIFFPEEQLEQKLRFIDVDASSFGCARSDGTQKPPQPIKPSNKPAKKKSKNKKKTKKTRKKNKTVKKARHKRSAAKMPAKKSKVKGKAKKAKPNYKGKRAKPKKKKKKVKPHKPVPSPPLPTPQPTKPLYFVCVYF